MGHSVYTKAMQNFMKTTMLVSFFLISNISVRKLDNSEVDKIVNLESFSLVRCLTDWSGGDTQAMTDAFYTCDLGFTKFCNT